MNENTKKIIEIFKVSKPDEVYEALQHFPFCILCQMGKMIFDIVHEEHAHEHPDEHD